MDKSKIDALSAELKKREDWFQKGSKTWGFVYHFCLYGTTIITLSIGFITQIEFIEFLGVSKNVLISLLAFIAAGLSAVIAKGGLDRKWKSNRINNGKISQLQLDMISNNPNYQEIVEKLKQIIADHDLAIVGTSIELKEA